MDNTKILESIKELLRHDRLVELGEVYRILGPALEDRINPRLTQGPLELIEHKTAGTLFIAQLIRTTSQHLDILVVAVKYPGSKWEMVESTYAPQRLLRSSCERIRKGYKVPAQRDLYARMNERFGYGTHPRIETGLYEHLEENRKKRNEAAKESREKAKAEAALWPEGYEEAEDEDELEEPDDYIPHILDGYMDY